MKQFLRKVKAFKLLSQKKIIDFSREIYSSITFEEAENLQEKYEFENFIIQIFESQKESFKILKKTVKVKPSFSHHRPSLLIEHIPTKERIALECKFRKKLKRSRIYHDKVLKWASSEQIADYKKFCEKFQIPLYIIIGLGGNPSEPKKSYCVPFEVANHPELLPSILEIYKREPTHKTFFWKNGNLK